MRTQRRIVDHSRLRFQVSTAANFPSKFCNSTESDLGQTQGLPKTSMLANRNGPSSGEAGAAWAYRNADGGTGTIPMWVAIPPSPLTSVGAWRVWKTGAAYSASRPRVPSSFGHSEPGTRTPVFARNPEAPRTALSLRGAG